MKKVFYTILFSGLVLLFSGGCVQLALHLAPSIVSDFKKTIFEECDPDLAENAIPGNLKLLEGLLKSDPNNPHVLLALCEGFTGYGLLFVEPESPERASRLYLRARDYGIRALGNKGKPLKSPESLGKGIQNLLKRYTKEDMEPLLWVSLSWSAWVNLNLDNPRAIAHLPVLDACMDKVAEMNGDLFFGLPWVLIGTTLSARPPLFGGDLDRAASCFKRAMEISGEKFFLIQYYYARYYAVRVQDRALFDRLLRDIVAGDPGALKEVCLINAVMQDMAEDLRNCADDLFI